MALPEGLRGRLRLPVIGAPLFVISTPDLVLAQCKAGIVGAFPALNARPASQLDEWLQQIQEGLHAWDQAHPETPSAPFAVNQIVHKSNDRLEEDLALCVKHKVPVVISSLGAQEAVNRSVHSYGGLILHDVTNNRFAHKAIEKGADGLIAVAAGAGGHAGTLSPFALMQEIREWFAKLPESDQSKMNFASGGNMEAKAWRDIWGCGQGVGAIHDVPSVAELVARFGFEFDEARKRLGEKLRPFSPSALPDPQ